jgi:hypothetical protein
MREVIEPTRVVMVEVRKDHGMDILGRIDTLACKRTPTSYIGATRMDTCL